MHFGDFVRAADGALGEWLEIQPPSTSTEAATKQYYALVRLLAKHLSQCAHQRKVQFPDRSAGAEPHSRYTPAHKIKPTLNS